MHRGKRLLSSLLIIAILISTYVYEVSYAADVPAQPAPSNLQITPLNPNSEPQIGYSSSDGGASGYYADIGWGSVADPQGITTAGKYVNIYLEESAKGYRTAKPVYLKEKDLPSGTTPIRMRNLTSGTIYKANAKAYYEYFDSLTGNRKKSDESVSSNTVKFMTDISLQCITMGTTKIKIVWDDVWNNGARISYKLYVSENKDFANTLPIYITPEQISSQGPVVANQTDGTLEYVHTVQEPGRVYYVKIVPDMSDPEIIRTAESKTVITSTYILVKTTKMSTTDAGTIWRLDWSPVVAGLSNSDIKVQYQIDKFVGNVPVPMLVEDSNTTFITVPSGEQVSYYLIRANVTKDGLPYYPDSVKIVSDKIILKEDEVSSTPPMPEIVPQFKDSAGNVIITYDDILNVDGSVIKQGELGKDTATVLWRAPKKADGTVDQSVLYDIWLVEDPGTIDDPPAASNIQMSFSPGETNYVRDPADNNNIIGYKYKLDGLKPNHTYYFKITAKKIFVEEVDGVIQNIEYASSPALKVIITKSGGAIDTPLIPSNPPLAIRKNANNTSMITDDSITIQLKNRWYEKYNPDTNLWSYIQADRTTLGEAVPYDPTNPNTPADMSETTDGYRYRKVQYGEGVSLYVGCVPYHEGIDISTIDTYKIEKFPTTANDSLEDPTLNAPENIPDSNNPAIYKKHNVVIPVDQLEANTTYILWVRAVRDGDPPLYSETSNPIIFTTLPSPSQVVEKPVVPAFTYSYIGDTYVDLGWNYKDGNKYYIKYGTVDDVTKATGTVEVTTAQIKQSGINYVRIPGLTTDTQYYFWIQAEAFSEDQTLSEKSEWSDSFPLRTLKDIPPSTPRGFGVKNTTGSVTKNSVTFEWIKEDGLEYILEVASGVDYTDLKQYQAGSVAEFKVDGLKSNFRYFARLYAYDPVKKLTSLPTQSISVRTLRSSDDYDSDQDVDNVISGDFIEKGTTVISGTWTVSIVGVNADRLIEKMSTDNKLDYTVDVSKPPSTANDITLIVSKKVFDKLGQLKENISFKTSAVTYDLKAGILANAPEIVAQAEQKFIFSMVLAPQKPSTGTNELLLRQPLAQISVTLDAGTARQAISRFATPLIVNYPYTLQKDYVEGKTKGFVFDATQKQWNEQSSWNKYDTDNRSGVISFSSQTPGLFALADKTSNLYDDIYDSGYQDSITNVATAHKLKSVTGRLFKPEASATVGDAVKLVLDTLDYTYGSEYMDSAVKAGLIKAGKTSGTTLTRQEAACMAAVLYKIKAGTKIEAATDTLKTYSDYADVDKTIYNEVAFAVENGFLPDAASTRLNPTGTITRGELMYMLEKALVLAGEL